jgi:AraC-like DNA-binding protein
MLKTTGIERYMLFLRLLDYLGSSESIPLASIGFANSINEFGEHRMEKIYKFCKHNFTRKLSLSEVSSLAAMNQTAFCRYFQKNTGKTFTQFINELRVSLACELLKNSNQTMAFICTKTGFNNMSNFNRVFLKIVGKTPSGYREFYKEE